MQVVGQLREVDDPAAVGRPGRIEAIGRTVVAVGGDLLRVPVGQVDQPQVQALVVQHDLAAVRRPAWLVEERRRLAERDLAHRAAAVGGADVQRVLAGFVRQPRDALAVGRRRGIAVGDARRLRQVADLALLGRRGEDVAVRLQDHALARRREHRFLDRAGHDGQVVRPKLRQVGVYRHGQRLHRAGGDVEDLELAEGVDDDAAGAGAGRGHVEAARVVDAARDRAGLGVVGVERGGAVAIGQEVQRVAHPHRVGVVAVAARHGRRVRRRQVGDPQPGRLAAAVLLPGRLPLQERRIG